jgi:hypothetical protein
MIVVRIWEGLGNQMFQYAYARALQLRTGQKVYIDVSRMYKNQLETKGINRLYTLDKFNIHLPITDGIEKKYFFLKQDNIIDKTLTYFSKKRILVPGFYIETTTLYNEDLRWVRGNKYLMGWFQNENYFSEYRSILLREFTPKEKIKISQRLKKILNENETVSVHIRRNDYKKTKNDLPIKYYRNAREYIENKVHNPYYIVFSDEITWVKANIDFGENVIYISDEENLHDYEELLVMSKCKHNIIANSTFSWWGAWLNRNDEKIVIGPRIWFNAVKDVPKYNIMPKDWIRI